MHASQPQVYHRFNCYRPLGHGGFAFVDFCESVERLLGRRVDVVTERSLHPLIRDRVLARAVPV